MVSEQRHIADLKPDAKNARRHNPRNIGMIVDSLHEVGPGRSIVIDEDNNILAGNGTWEAAAQAGIEKVQIIERDPEAITAVRVRGLSKKAKKRLALFDNRTAELADWEPSVLQDEKDILDGLFTGQELEALLADISLEDAFGALPDGDKAPFEQMTFTLSNGQADTVRAAMQRARADGAFVETGNENSNGNALARICEAYLG